MYKCFRYIYTIFGKISLVICTNALQSNVTFSGEKQLSNHLITCLRHQVFQFVRHIRKSSSYLITII